MTDPTPLAAAPRHPKSVVFFGTPVDAVPALQALVGAGFEVPLVVSPPDRRRGRGSALSPSPVKAAALKLGLPVTSEVADALDVGADIGVVVAYGHLIRRPMLEQLPMLNIHFSLLPRWRGAAPVERALLSGDAETGVCLMGLEVGLDTGPVYARATTPIGPTDRVSDLRERLAIMGAELLVEQLTVGLSEPEPQEGEATHATKIESADREIDWSADAVMIDRQVRLGGAWTLFRGKRFKIHAAELLAVDAGPTPGTVDDLVVATGRGSLRLVSVQPEGKPRQDATDWARGARLTTNDRFGS